MKFTKSKVDNLLGGVEVRYTEGSTLEDPFIIVASIQGVQLKGTTPMIQSTEDLDVLAQTLSKAWAQHRTFMPKFTQNERGH